jgi:hypothetical protein
MITLSVITLSSFHCINRKRVWSVKKNWEFSKTASRLSGLPGLYLEWLKNAATQITNCDKYLRWSLKQSRHDFTIIKLKNSITHLILPDPHFLFEQNIRHASWKYQVPEIRKWLIEKKKKIRNRLGTERV